MDYGKISLVDNKDMWINNKDKKYRKIIILYGCIDVIVVMTLYKYIHERCYIGVYKRMEVSYPWIGVSKIREGWSRMMDKCMIDKYG